MNTNGKKVTYAVVGLGHIAQVAVLPAFTNASGNSQLTTLISDDPKKLELLSKRYGISNCYSYEQYDEALKSGNFDAIYIALPNDMHKEFAIKAAKAGIHILCEKPMALTEEDCQQMISEATTNKVKLMIAYRLHFEKTNMKAVELIHSGKIGEPKVFNSSFTMQVKEGNIRTQRTHGGGPLYDIGIYCINAARYLFKDEPIEVVALNAQSSDPRFTEIEECMGAILKFPKERIATFVCGFGSFDVSRYEVIGTEGIISLEPAYDYVEELEYKLKSKDHIEQAKTPKRDQFAPELIHFSESILENTEPRPSGVEGLADIAIIEAIKRSAQTRKSVVINHQPQHLLKPDVSLIQEKPAVKKPLLVNAESGSKS